MANFNSVQLGGGAAGGRNFPVSGVGEGGRTRHGARGSYTITAALALNDTIQLFDLPPRARIVGGFIKSDDLDTGGSALAVVVGDAGDDDRYFAASTIPGTGGVTTTLAATGVDYVTTAKTRVILKVSTGPTNGATTGTIVVVLEYWVEEPA